MGGTAVAVAVAVGGCGSDDDGGGDSAATESAAQSSTGSSGGDPAAFCEANVDIESAFVTGPQIDETSSEEEIQAALQEFSGVLEPLLARAEGTAPEEVADDVATAAGAVREALETGDFAATDTEEFRAADGAIDDYVLAECGFEQVEATLVDHRFEGIPAELPAGVVAFTLTNEGNEAHELSVARINDGVDQPLTEIVALPEEEALSLVAPVGGGFAEPGGSDTVFLRLEEPGRYGAVCFVPQGSTAGVEGSGPPHAALGMVTEFQVV